MTSRLATIADERPTVAIIADDPFGISRSKAIVDAAGGQPPQLISFNEAVERLDVSFYADTIIVEMLDDFGPDLDRILDTVDRTVRRDSVALLLTVPLSMIDAVSARITVPWATILCDPTSAERVAALSLAWAEQRARLNDRGGDQETARLRNLAHEVGRIAHALASMSDSNGLAGPRATYDAPLGYQLAPADRFAPRVDAAQVRLLIKERRARERYFQADLFADPAWDMMLDLMAARIEHVRVSVSSLCIAAAVPPTTALRWIKTLTDAGIFVRVADPTDGRRVFIELSDSAAHKIAEYFSGVERLSSVPAAPAFQ